MLLSGAVERAIQDVNFGDLQGQRVYLDTQYLDAIDKGYIVSSMRHRLLQSGGVLVNSPQEADLVLEVRSGGVGTDTRELFFGVPEITVPGMVSFPEVKLLSRATQFGRAKFGLVAYNPQTGKSVGDGGETVAVTDDDNWYFMGLGPLQRGSLKKEISDAAGVPETPGANIAEALIPGTRTARRANQPRISLVSSDYRQKSRTAPVIRAARAQSTRRLWSQ